MPIEKILDLSTGHMTLNDSRLLGLYDVPHRGDTALIVYRFTHGWTVSTAGLLESPTEKAERFDRTRAEGFSEAFIKVLDKAASEGAVMVRFDCDAEYEPGLQIFDWDAEAKIEAATNPERTRYHCTTFSFRALSEGPFGPVKDLAQIHEAVTTGDCVGGFLTSVETELTAKQAADTLYTFGSEPGFFHLDDEGRDPDADDEEFSAPKGP